MSARTTEVSDYQLFGLTIRSEIPLPELIPAEGGALPHVTILRGELPKMDEDWGVQADSEGILLNIPTVARYRISGGSEIMVDAKPDVPERNVRLFLLGSAFGALLHQRGLLPLHANAIEVDGRAVAFMGESGAGKSTLAAWFHDRGFRVIADDVCVVGFDDKAQPYATPGLPRLRLWAEALELMGRRSANYEHSYVSTAGRFEKFDVPIARDAATTWNVPLMAVYKLDKASESSITPLRPLEAIEFVFENTYRGSFLGPIGTHQQHWEAAVRLVNATPVYRAARRWDFARLSEDCDELLGHVEAIARKS